MTLSKPNFPKVYECHHIASHGFCEWLWWGTTTVEFLAGWRDGCPIGGKNSCWGKDRWTLLLLLMVGGDDGVAWVQGSHGSWCRISTMYSDCQSNTVTIIWCTVTERIKSRFISFVEKLTGQEKIFNSLEILRLFGASCSDRYNNVYFLCDLADQPWYIIPLLPACWDLVFKYCLSHLSHQFVMWALALPPGSRQRAPGI